MYRSHISFLDVTSPSFGIPLASLSQVKNEYVFASSIVFWTVFWPSIFFRFSPFLGIPSVFQGFGRNCRMQFIDLAKFPWMLTQSNASWPQFFSAMLSGSQKMDVSMWRKSSGGKIYAFFLILFLSPVQFCSHLLPTHPQGDDERVDTEVVETPWDADDQKPTQDRYAALEKDIATFAGVCLGDNTWHAILHLDTVHIHTNIQMQKPQYILDFTNICQQYIYINLTSFAQSVGQWGRSGPQISGPENCAYQTTTSGSSCHWAQLELKMHEHTIPCLLCCYVFYPTKNCLTEYDMNVFVGKTVVFSWFSWPFMVMATWGCPNKSRWRTLSPEASVSGRDYCAARGRSCVKSTVRIPWERAEIQGACADGFPGY